MSTTLSTTTPEATQSVMTPVVETQDGFTSENVKDALLTIAEYAHLTTFMVLNDGRPPEVGEARGLLVAYVDEALRSYMLRPDKTVPERLAIAQQVIERRREQTVALAIQRRQAKDSLS